MFVLPIPRHEDFRTWNRRTPIVWSVLILNAVVFLLTLPHANSYIARYAFVPATPTALTATTSMFRHSGWIHIIGNMFFLIIFGRAVERAIGSVKFAFSYVLAGFAALGMHALITPAPAMPVVGASGAISGVVGMYLALFPRAQVDLHAYLGYWHVRTWRSTGLVATGVWFIEQLVLALLSSAAGAVSGIAFLGTRWRVYLRSRTGLLGDSPDARVYVGPRGRTVDASQAVPADVWWRARRLRYNIGLIVAGMCAFALYVWAFEVRCLGALDAEITLFTTAFQAVGYVMAMGLANACYQLGPTLERMVPARRVDSYRRAAYTAGFIFSIVAPFSIPVVVALRGCAGS